MTERCIFCKIIKGEIPSKTVYEDASFKGILDISPASKGHIILISKKHIENIFEIDDKTAADAFLAARKVSTAMIKALNCPGINVLQNNNEIAGQTVFHFHIHLIPRYQDDNIDIKWKPSGYKEGEDDRLVKSLIKFIN